MFRKLLIPAFASLAVASIVPTPSIAQARGNQTYRPTNAQATKDMRTRLAAAIDRVRVTEEHGKLSRTRSAALRNQLAQARREMTAF